MLGPNGGALLLLKRMSQNDMYRQKQVINTYVCTHACMFVCIHYVHACLCVHICVHVYYLYVYIDVCAYIYVLISIMYTRKSAGIFMER